MQLWRRAITIRRRRKEFAIGPRQSSASGRRVYETQRPPPTAAIFKKARLRRTNIFGRLSVCLLV